MPSVNEIIAAANTRTENRANNELDLVSEFWQMLSEFMKEKRYWWREVSATFMTVVGQQTYDLSAAAGGEVPDFDEMNEVFVIPPSSGQPVGPFTGPQPARVNPLLLREEQAQALEATQNGPPAGYFMQLGTYQTLVFANPCDNIYKIRYFCWAIPDLSFSNPAQTIPYIPRSLQWGLVIGMERTILRYLYGQEDPRAEAAEERYQQFIEKAARAPEFTTKKQVSFATSEEAVRAF